eukprot:CAMPEP_0114252418 /NCGR_PEP_ID=MMETSP0058-20121206/15826_1 /TAXON_ID=36894 /ORGANISM="Pyramimonas parkeae, CCMP726" /LENGTH=358 /DNA_ID=CAMNT_0001366351 /DNA_START=185 /DNA_END=1261 /DNA_ORIENTATION=-
MQDFDCWTSTENLAAEAQPSDDHYGVDNGQYRLEPLLPGIMPGKTKPRLVLAAQPNWPPCAFVNLRTGAMEGVAADIAKGMGELCGFDVVIAETKWTDCWADQKIGRGLLNGHYHGCMTYTYTKGARDRQMEFSHAFLQDIRPAGLLVRLKEDGTPEIDGNHNLAGKKVVHISGWAPTEDGLAYVQNACTGEPFTGYTMVPSSEIYPNDDALGKLLDGTVDAMWVYVDQGENYMYAGCIADDPNKKSASPEWDCAKWAGLGKKFAFIHTGQFGHSVNGSTLTISKKGSGLVDIINPCMNRFMQTEEYYKVCANHGLAQDCYPNAFFPEEYLTSTIPVWDVSTKDLQSKCSDGYCPCPM